MVFLAYLPMKLILVRHAETTANAQTVILGGGEGGELSEHGMRQAQALARRLAGENLSEVCSSSANRAKQTCEAIVAGRDLAIAYCDELLEINMGELVGLSHEDAKIKFPGVFQDIFANPDRRIPGGESIVDVQRRVMPLIERLATKPGNPTVLAVGHNIVNRVILATLLGIPLARGKSIKQKNASVSILDVKPGFAQLYTLDNSLHTVR
jgi:broad specificity phosphatase PhoE